MSNKIDVLDHGYVRLVSYMQPVPLDGETTFSPAKVIDPNWTGDLEIVRNARVSYDADWRKPEMYQEKLSDPDAKLINYLYQHAHTSPFEAMVFTFEVQAPIFIFRQWHRHRTWSYNEVSARYTELPDLFYIPELKNIGMQSKTNKQGRDLERQTEEESQVVHYYQITLEQNCRKAAEQYKRYLDQGISRELARLVLPVNIYSRMFATVNLHNLFRFLTLRMDSHAQFEIREYARALLELVEPICPIAVDAFKQGIYEADPLNPPPGLARE